MLSKGFLYGLTARNDLFCLNVSDGKTAWTTPFSANPPSEGQAGAPGTGGPVGDRPRGEPGAGSPGGERPEGGPGGGRGRGGGGMRGGGMGYGSVVDAGSVMLALTPASQLVVFQPGDKSYTELARIKVASSPTYAYPVVSGKRLFIKDQDSVMLYAVE